MTRGSQRGTVRDSRLCGASNAGLLVDSSAFIACPTLSTSPTWDLMGGGISSSVLVPRYEIMPHCGVPSFSHGWQLCSCHAAQRRRNTLHNSYRFLCHPTHHLGPAVLLIGAPKGHSLRRHGHGLRSCFANFPNKTVLRPTKTNITQGPQGSAQIRDKCLPPSARLPVRIANSLSRRAWIPVAGAGWLRWAGSVA